MENIQKVSKEVIMHEAQKLIDKSKQIQPDAKIKENNKSVREYTQAEKMVFSLAEKNLNALDAALKNAVISENDCAKIITEVQPVGDKFDKYFRIVEVISRYDGAWKANPYKGRAPQTKRSPADSLEQINFFK